MKRAWTIAAIPFLWAGCQRKPAQNPPLVACRVEISRLVKSHPRWVEIEALSQQERALQARLRAPLPLPGHDMLPAKMPAIPPPPTAIERAAPEALSYFVTLGDASVRNQQAQMEQHHRERLEAERLLAEVTGETETRLSRGKASDKLWREHAKIISSYQKEITRLRSVIARLRDPLPVPGERKPQFEGKDPAAWQRDLDELERRQENELAAVTHRIEQQLAEEQQRREWETRQAIQSFEENLRTQREIALNTARQDWQDRMDAADAALCEAPPGPVVPPLGSAAAPGLAPAVQVASMPREAGNGRKAMAELRAQRVRLERALREEIRRRVLGIAERYRLAPRFDAAGRNLPDRTDFFAREISFAKL